VIASWKKANRSRRCSWRRLFVFICPVLSMWRAGEALPSDDPGTLNLHGFLEFISWLTKGLLLVFH
jgi:hypothetical protein